MGRGSNKADDEVVVKLLGPVKNVDPSQKNKSCLKIDKDKGILVSNTIHNIPPGIPPCDVLLKGSNRFWYLESALFVFGIVGVVFSAAMLIWHYLHSSIYL